ncbi:hypothetical protein EMPS_11037 [Entomortierella parvispora]|uniref:Golgi apparatus membrane protein TVP38 n=1 Tax=Entomortierella parvispora TaxID=205924 RepID=A0A9P3HLS3_9FUNG|nr:hypothetical protein EMPS_11037 [Entomortierella parvispora]
MNNPFTEPSYFSGDRPSAPRIDRHNSGTSSIRLEDPSDLSSGAGFGSATSKFTGAALSLLTRIQDRLPERFRPWFWLGLWFSVVGLIIGLFAGFHSEIFQFLESLATFLKELGPLGPPVLMACLFVTSFPPMIGYSSIVTMAGYVYGFLFGFAIAFSAALAGSIVCFYFCRRWFKAQVRTLMSKNKSLKSVVRTVEKRGFRLLVLIRLAPYPFNVMNALLSATHIPLPTFALATAISLLKLTLHVYIGSTLSTLTGSNPDEEDDPSNPDKKNHGKALKVVVMVMSIFLGIGVGAYVWMVAKREVAITEAIRIERRRRRRLGLQTHQRMPSDGSEIELGPNSIPNVDITNRGSLAGLFGQSSNYPDGSALNSDYVGGGYLDDDEDEHEEQSLFGNFSDPLGPFQQSQLHQQPDDWRNVGAVDLDMSTDSEDTSDYTDEEGHDNRSPLDLERGMPEYGLGYEEEEEGGALDFSAHHAGLVDSPWHNDPALDGVPEEDEDDGDDLTFHSNTSKSGGNGVW